jgi:hypothetical protein
MLLNEVYDMTLHKYIMHKALDTDIELLEAAEKMGVNYHTLYSQLRSGKIYVEWLMQLSDIYGFTLEDMKRGIKYKHIKPTGAVNVKSSGQNKGKE